MKKFYVVVIFVILIGYALFTIINQQQTLNQYAKDKEELTTQIAEENEHREQLNEKKNNVNSLEFIEQMAREKLDMYLPNEKVYVDQGI